MFKFEHPEYLYLLLCIPALLGLYLLYRFIRTRTWLKIADEHMQERLMGNLSQQKEWIQISLVLGGLALVSLSLANPQWGFKKQKVERQAADVFIALDISNSMLARDIAPSRLERAKKFASSLIEELKGDRIGLISFAGSAYLQMPLSTDYAATEFFIKSANPANATTQGTAIGEALKLAVRAYEEDEVIHKALIIITDGESHDEDAAAQMKIAEDMGLVPFIVGVGTEKGDFIPMMIRGKEDYKRDENGNPVRSIMNEPLMQDLAQSGGGQYFNILNGDAAISALKDRIENLEKRDIEQRSFTDFESYFQYFLGLGLVLLILSEVISRRKGKIRSLIQSVKEKAQ